MPARPGARLRVALSALTMAEWFRDATGTETLLFVDNIFRFSQAGPDHSDARSYLRYKAALATMPARSQHEQRTAA